MMVKSFRILKTCPFSGLSRMLLILFALLNGNCSKSPELENYEKCLQLLNEERLQALESQNYTYDSQRFLECRAPAHYGSSPESS